MSIYNVMTHVVDLVEADSEEEAIGKLHARLDARGFTVHFDRGVHEPNAFESETLPSDVEVI